MNLTEMLRRAIDAFLLALAQRLAVLIAEPLLDAAVDPELRKALPAIYERLDEKMPTLLSEGNPIQVTNEFASAIQDVVEKPVKALDIRTVARIYNPIAAVLRNT